VPSRRSSLRQSAVVRPPSSRQNPRTIQESVANMVPPICAGAGPKAPKSSMMIATIRGSPPSMRETGRCASTGRRRAALARQSAKRSSVSGSPPFGGSDASRSVAVRGRKFQATLEAERLEEAAGFGECFLVFGGRIRVRHNSRPGVEIGGSVQADCRANGNAKLALAIEAEITNGAGVGTAGDRLQFVDDFHGPDLG